MDQLKKEEMVLIKNCSREYRKKRIPIPTHKCKYGDVTEEYVFDLTLKIRIQKKEMTTNEVNYVVGTFL